MSSEAGEGSGAGRGKAKEISVLVGSGDDEESGELELAHLCLVADAKLERSTPCVAAYHEKCEYCWMCVINPSGSVR